MSAPSAGTDSRRGFLKHVLTAGVAAGAAALPAPRARAADGGANNISPLRVGNATIADHVIGPVVVLGKEYDYLVYDASRGAGVAVVRLTDCVDWRLRPGGDAHLPGRAADPSVLDECQTYEVKSSAWVADLVDDDPDLAAAGAPPLHHLVFTFLETHFECVVARYDFMVHEGSFGELVDHLSAAG